MLYKNGENCMNKINQKKLNKYKLKNDFEINFYLITN